MRKQRDQEEQGDQENGCDQTYERLILWHKREQPPVDAQTEEEITGKDSNQCREEEACQTGVKSPPASGLRLDGFRVH